MSSEDKEQSILAHLEELRKTVLDSLIVIAIVFPFAFFFSPKILDMLIAIIKSGSPNLQLNYFAPMEVFFIQIKLAILIDVIVCFPYVAKRAWDYILPALYDNERQIILASVLSSTLLFLSGVGFCLFLILPFIIKFGLSFQQENAVQAVFGLSNVINLSLSLALVFGLMFQIPLVISMLIKWDIVSYEDLAEKRSYIFIIILIISALLTPPDIVSQILLATPTYLLFEAGLYFGKRKAAD